MASRPDPPQTRSFRSDGLCLGALFLAVAVLLWPVILGGRAPVPDYLGWFAAGAGLPPPRSAWNPLWYDALGQYWPWRTLLRQGLLGNVLPLWNPYQFGGYAFVGNGQSALFYPLNWVLFGLGPVSFGFRATAELHLWLAGAGTYWLLRELRAERSAALLGGLAFSLCGFLVSWLTLPTLLSSAAWLPVALACLERARRLRRPVWGSAAGFAVGLSALAGHPQVFYYVALAVVAAALLSVAGAPERSARVLLTAPWPIRVGMPDRASLSAAWRCLAVSTLVAAPTLLPVLELAPRSHRPPQRTTEGYTGFLTRAIPIGHTITLFLPEFYGTPRRGSVDPERPAESAAAGAYWGADRRGVVSPGDYTEFNLFVGLLPLWLALLAVGGGDRRAVPYAGGALLAFWLALGGGLNRWLYFHAPGWSAGAGPCRLALLWCFGVAVCAGLGLDRWLRGEVRPRTSFVAMGVVILIGIGAWQLAARGVAARGLAPLLAATAWRHLLAVCIAAGTMAAGLAMFRWAPRLLPLAVAAELLAVGVGFTPTCPARWLDRPPARLSAWLSQIGPHERVVALDRPERWRFDSPPFGLVLPPNLATVAGIRDLGGYDSLLTANAKDRVAALTAGRPVTPMINGNLLLLGHVDVGPALADLGVSMALGEEAGPAPVPVTGGATSRLSPPGAGEFRYDGINRVALRTRTAAIELRDSADPGWRCYVSSAGAPFTSHRWRGSNWREVHELPAAADVRWVFSPTAVRVGLFLALCASAWVVADAVPAIRARRKGPAVA